jgi:ATP-binding cassette subfamily C (CFTR/MRP) protein 4
LFLSRIVILLLTLLRIFIVLNGRLAAKFRESVAKQTDERSRIMNEIVMAISVIKMYAWEKPFSKIINAIRG